MEQIYRIKHLKKFEGKSLRKIAEITGHDFETVKKYVDKNDFNIEVRPKQITLLPDCIEDYIGEDNSVRVIDAFVNSLDITKAGFLRSTPNETGRPYYNPKDLLKLYVYGYFNKIRSSRKLIIECTRTAHNFVVFTSKSYPVFALQ